MTFMANVPRSPFYVGPCTKQMFNQIFMVYSNSIENLSHQKCTDFIYVCLLTSSMATYFVGFKLFIELYGGNLIAIFLSI